MTAAEIVEELRPLGAEGYRKILHNHGVPEPVFGVKIEELQKIRKRIKKDYQVALDLWDTGIYDARYLAGLIADDLKMTKKDLRHWAASANCSGLSEYTVAWVAAEGRYGWELGLEWIESREEWVATAGWSTLGSLVALRPDAELDMPALRSLLQRIGKTIHAQPNRVRYAMNSFLIAAGAYVAELTELARKTAAGIGKVHVEMGGTACKVPDAADYIRKIEQRGALGKKRKTVKC